jgi:hypothetical protein
VSGERDKHRSETMIFFLLFFLFNLPNLFVIFNYFLLPCHGGIRGCTKRVVHESFSREFIIVELSNKIRTFSYRGVP